MQENSGARGQETGQTTVQKTGQETGQEAGQEVQKPGFTIRLAGPADHPGLAALYRRASLANEGDREFLLSEPDLLQLDSAAIECGCCWLVESEDAGGILGFVSLEPGPVDSQTVMLDGLFVEPDLWRHGLGRALLAHACERARASGALSMEVLANTHALAFYRREGFEPMGEEPQRFGVAHRMRRQLA